MHCCQHTTAWIMQIAIFCSTTKPFMTFAERIWKFPRQLTPTSIVLWVKSCQVAQHPFASRELLISTWLNFKPISCHILAFTFHCALTPLSYRAIVQRLIFLRNKLHTHVSIRTRSSSSVTRERANTFVAACFTVAMSSRRKLILQFETLSARRRFASSIGVQQHLRLASIISRQRVYPVAIFLRSIEQSVCCLTSKLSDGKFFRIPLKLFNYSEID